MRVALTAVVIATVVAALPAQQAPSAPFNDSITVNDLRADLHFLAGDHFRGRLTNTPENAIAAEFIKARFERLGLAPAAPERSFFQHYNLMTATLGERNALTVSARDAAPTLELSPAQDYYPQRFSASGRARGPIVFAGYGIVDADARHDDFKGIDLTGRIVLVLDHEPGENDSTHPLDGVVTAQAANPLLKALNAQQRGAAGILFVQDVHNHPEPSNFEAAARAYWPERPPRIDAFTLASWMERVRIPAAQISPALAATLLDPSGRTLEELGKAAETPGGVTPAPIDGPTIELVTTVNRHIVPDRNVVAMVEGSDPALKDEWVVVCAHFDHDGADDTRVYNGADDDGSGTVALLEIAEAYAFAARAGQRPKRSVLFAAWNSEERGLLGAWAFVEAPLFPLATIVATLNMDMIGRNEEVPEGGGRRFGGLDLQTAESNANAVNLLGTTFSRDLANVVIEDNEALKLDLRVRYDNNASNLVRRSDQWPFLQRNVPSLFFHTGLHPDYHTVYDRPEKINYEKMARIARLVHRASWTLATQAGRPRWDGRVNTRPASSPQARDGAAGR
jgi:hypothetical protein